MIATYDPKNILLSISGINISGFGENSMVVVNRAEDAYTKVTGTDGETIRVKSLNRTGSLEITLLQSSQSNDVLSSLANADALTGLGMGALLLKDLNGTTIVQSAKAWVAKWPSAEFGKTQSDRVWTIDTGELNQVVGGVFKV